MKRVTLTLMDLAAQDGVYFDTNREGGLIVSGEDEAVLRWWPAICAHSLDLVCALGQARTLAARVIETVSHEYP